MSQYAGVDAGVQAICPRRAGGYSGGASEARRRRPRGVVRRMLRLVGEDDLSYRPRSRSAGADDEDVRVPCRGRRGNNRLVPQPGRGWLVALGRAECCTRRAPWLGASPARRPGPATAVSSRRSPGPVSRPSADRPAGRGTAGRRATRRPNAAAKVATISLPQRCSCSGLRRDDCLQLGLLAGACLPRAMMRRSGSSMARSYASTSRAAMDTVHGSAAKPATG